MGTCLGWKVVTAFFLTTRTESLPAFNDTRLCCEHIFDSISDTIYPAQVQAVLPHEACYKPCHRWCTHCVCVCTIHQNVKEFNCSQCEKLFTSIADQQKHEASVHKKKYEEPIKSKCEICNKWFANEFGKKKHVNFVHTDKSKHGCHLCDKTFNLPFFLKQHIKRFHEKIKSALDIHVYSKMSNFGPNISLQNCNFQKFWPLKY